MYICVDFAECGISRVSGLQSVGGQSVWGLGLVGVMVCGVCSVWGL